MVTFKNQRKKHKVQTSMFNGYKCLQKGAGKMQIKGQKGII